MIVLKNFRPDILKNEYRKGVPFRWNYIDADTNEIISRKEAKRRNKIGKKVIGLYNPTKLINEYLAQQEESSDQQETSDG